MNGARFFRMVQDAPWYAHFLQPVLAALQTLPPGAAVLDVGTGAGKLLELGQALPHLRWAGVDTDAAMLAEARKRPSLHQTPLHHLTPNALLPFPDAHFDVVTVCSVLFLLSDPTPLLAETWRILRPNGRLIALTPSGSKGTPGIMRTIGWRLSNWPFFLWRQMTARNGRRWAQQETLVAFARQHNAAYRKQAVFHGLATVESVSWDQPSSSRIDSTVTAVETKGLPD